MAISQIQWLFAEYRSAVIHHSSTTAKYIFPPENVQFRFRVSFFGSFFGEAKKNRRVL
jgi:hypothetical protein